MLISQNKTSIKTHLYQLGLIQNTLKKSQICSNRGETSALSLNESVSGVSQQNGENISIGASTLLPNRIWDLTRGQKKTAPDVFQRKLDEFDYLIDIFKQQIDSDFDEKLIEK